MVTINSMVKTVKTTNNFWDALALRFSTTKKTIKFRNGVKAEADYRQYTLLRDWFEELHRKSFNIHITSDSYLIRNSHGNLGFSFKTRDILTAKPFFDFLLNLTSNGWIVKRIGFQYKIEKSNSTCIVEQLSENQFCLKSDRIEIIGPNGMLYVHLNESESGLYEYDYQGKTVLDIGGFCGETAAFFSGEGAKKVIVYEPVQEHQSFIKKNAALNNVNLELHDVGIAKTDGTLSINYDFLDLGFGLPNGGQNKTTIKTKNVTDVLLHSRADVAKIDCEGAETSLLDVSPEILELIDFYFIETHSDEIEEAIVCKFYDSGFVMAREPVKLSQGISMLYFTKCNRPTVEVSTINAVDSVLSVPAS